ncbi:MAG: hypothetical protein ABI625_07190 [bacterium]
MKQRFYLPIRSAVMMTAACLVMAMTMAVVRPAHVFAPVRRPVALVLSIDAPTYWDRLDQSATCGTNCRQLQFALAEPVRAALGRKFAFADWRPANIPPCDTVRVRWIEKPPPATPGAWIEFRLVGAGRAQPDSLRVDFEDFSNMIDRRDWLVANVRDQWVRRLSTILERAELVPLLFGRIPMNVQVAFTPGASRVRVPLSGTDIGAAAEARMEFRVVATIDDPGPPRSTATGVVSLTGCIGGVASYVCDIERIRYAGGTVVTGAPLTDLLARKPAIKATSVLLQSYSAGSSALVPPGVPR